MEGGWEEGDQRETRRAGGGVEESGRQPMGVEGSGGGVGGGRVMGRAGGGAADPACGGVEELAGRLGGGGVGGGRVRRAGSERANSPGNSGSLMVVGVGSGKPAIAQLSRTWPCSLSANVRRLNSWWRLFCRFPTWNRDFRVSNLPFLGFRILISFRLLIDFCI